MRLIIKILKILYTPTLGIAVFIFVIFPTMAKTKFVENQPQNISTFKADCEDVPDSQRVTSKIAYCMNKRELPVTIGGEQFIFPENIVKGFQLAKSEIWKYGDNTCNYPLNICGIGLKTISGDGGIEIATKQFPMPYDWLKTSSFADRLNQKPTKMISSIYGEFSVIKILTGHEHIPITNSISDGGVIFIFTQPNNTNHLIITCSHEPMLDPIPHKIDAICKAWYRLNNYTYFLYNAINTRGFDEVKLFEQFMQTKRNILSYKIESKKINR